MLGLFSLSIQPVLHRICMMQEWKLSKLKNNSLASHSKPQEIYYFNSKSQHNMYKFYSRFLHHHVAACIHYTLAIYFRPLNISALCETVLSLLLFEQREALTWGWSGERGDLETVSQMLLPQCENAFVSTVGKATEQFICFVQGVTLCGFPLSVNSPLLKMLHVIELLDLKEKMSHFSSV